MTRSGATRTASLVMLAFFSLLALQGTSRGALSPELAELEQRFQTRRVPTDFMVFADTTASMEQAGYWNSLRSKLAEFASNLPAGSTFTLLRCESHSSEIVRPTKVNSFTLPAIRRDILERQRARGRYRDVGESLATSMRLVSSNGPDRDQFLIFILNGPHRPSPSSRFPEGREPWGLLVAARNDLADRPVSVHIIALSDQVDMALFESVFAPDGEPRILTETHARLADVDESLEGILNAMEEEKLRMAVVKEMHSGWVAAEPAQPLVGIDPGSARTVAFRLASGYEHLDAEVTIQGLSHPERGFAVSHDLAGRKIFLPAGGGTEPLQIELSNNRVNPERWTVPGRIEVPMPIALSLEVRFAPQASLARLGIDTRAVEKKPTADFTVVYLSAVSTGLMVAAGAGALVLFFVIAYLLRVPFPAGWSLAVVANEKTSLEPLHRFNRAFFGRGIVQVNRRGSVRRSLKDGCLEIRAHGRNRLPKARPLKGGITLEGEPLKGQKSLKPHQEIRISKTIVIKLTP